MDSSQIIANVLVAFASASILLGAVDPVRVCYRMVCGRSSRGLLSRLSVSCGLRLADRIFALILINRIRQPLLEGGCWRSEWWNA